MVRREAAADILVFLIFLLEIILFYILLTGNYPGSKL